MKLILTIVLTMLASGCVAAPGSKAGGGTVLVCHRGKTMELPQEALRAHINHGDRAGPC